MDLINNSDEIDVMIVRAEEHTAQINTTKDDDEMYTAAEEFELLFQDIPFVIPEDDEHWTPPQSPIDVLSCTTTMEVGIDIGSLTTVALRTVPREPANYQQAWGVDVEPRKFVLRFHGATICHTLKTCLIGRSPHWHIRATRRSFTWIIVPFSDVISSQRCFKASSNECNMIDKNGISQCSTMLKWKRI